MVDESGDHRRGGDVGDRRAVLVRGALHRQQEARDGSHPHAVGRQGGDLRRICCGHHGFMATSVEGDANGDRMHHRGRERAVGPVLHGRVHRVLLRVQEEPWIGLRWLLCCSCESQHNALRSELLQDAYRVCSLCLDLVVIVSYYNLIVSNK